MDGNTNEIEDVALPLPITQNILRIANHLASQQPTPEKVEQVLLNVIAVCVVNNYLQMLGIATDLPNSTVWKSMCSGSDIADLEVTGVGKLECRPIKMSKHCYIPPEVWLDRIGYVVVRIDESLRQAAVLGFTESAAAEIPLSKLRPLEELIDHLHQIMKLKARSPELIP